jgi:putative membrane protein insertion efficiency factor
MDTAPAMARLRAAARAIAALPRELLLLLLRGYRLLLSPWLGSACRFEPTCSLYAMQAIQRHGAAWGSGLAAWRVLRCHPWCDGGCDPVPDRAPALFTGLPGLATRRKTKV